MGEERLNIACLLSKVNHIHVCAHVCARACMRTDRQVHLWHESKRGTIWRQLQNRVVVHLGSALVWWLPAMSVLLLLWDGHVFSVPLYAEVCNLICCLQGLTLQKLLKSQKKSWTSLLMQLNIILFKVPSSSGAFLSQWGCGDGGQVKNGQYSGPCCIC